MALSEYEIAEQYAGLDQDAAGDGVFRSTHVLRALSRSGNRLVIMGEPLLSLTWDAAEFVGETSPEQAVRSVAGLTWTRLLPGVLMRPKKPGLRFADLFISAEVPEGMRVRVQLETMRSPLDVTPSGLAGRTLVIDGDATMKTYILRDVPIDEGGYERFGFWVRGEASTLEGDVSTHTVGGAGHNDGNVYSITPEGDLIAEQFVGSFRALNWNSGAGTLTWASDHYVTIHSGDLTTMGVTLFEAQIVAVPDSAALRVWPGPPGPHAAAGLRGRPFIIRQLPKIRCCAIAVDANDREV